jgi:succinate dehydrogenase / fumarate reductase membrane anchor subunit
MIGETIVRQAAARKGREGSLFELYSWFFMRVSGTLLLVIVVFHLLYMHFIIPGGVAKTTFETIVGRWLGPWGAFWRTFDLLLLAFAFTHGTNGIRFILEDYIHHDGWRTFIKTLLYLLYIVLIILGAYIIFSFKGTPQS